MQKLSIVNLTALTVALAGTATVAGKVFEDGEVTLGDLKHAKAALDTLKKYKGVDYKSLLPEAKDLDDKEREDLAALFAQTFVLPPAAKTTEEVVEAGLGYLLLAVQALGVFLPDATGAAAVPFKRA